jgi:hypothetical protein
LFATVAALVAAPAGFGHSFGMAKDVASDYPDDFPAKGCTKCHGDGKWAPGGLGKVTYAITQASGAPLSGNAYAKGTSYLINITLNEEQEPGKTNHAGFHLAVSGGKLESAGIGAPLKFSNSGTQATHADASSTKWTVKWTPPDAGAVSFDLFVNDVNGDNANDKGDNVYRLGFWLTDAAGAQLGAAAAEHAVQFGISLQQYWIGLLGLAGMIFIMVGGYVYLKFVNPHNTDQEDR